MIGLIVLGGFLGMLLVGLYPAAPIQNDLGQITSTTTDGVTLMNETNQDVNAVSDFYHNGDTYTIVDHSRVIASLRMAYGVALHVARVTPSEVYLVEYPTEIVNNGSGPILHFISRANGSVGTIQAEGIYWGSLPNGDMIFATGKNKPVNNAGIVVSHYGYVPVDSTRQIGIALPDSCQFIRNVLIQDDLNTLEVWCDAGKHDDQYFYGEAYEVKLEPARVTFIRALSQPFEEGPVQPFFGTPIYGIITQD